MTLLDQIAPAMSAPGRIPTAVPERGLVHIVDVDHSARASLARWLTAAGLAAQAYEGVKDVAAKCSTPQCVVVDMQALWSAGFGSRTLVWPFAPRIPVIVTAHRPDIAMAVMAMKTGAADFVEKPLRRDEIVSAITMAVDADRARARLEAGAILLRQRFASLSRREQQVMALVTTGMLNKQVGGALGVTEITVKAHRGAAMRKMAALSFADLVRMAEGLEEELAPLRNGC